MFAMVKPCFVISTVPLQLQSTMSMVYAQKLVIYTVTFHFMLFEFIGAVEM